MILPSAGSVLVWDFSTAHQDIAFSVTLTGIGTVVPCTRESSHEREVVGSFTTPHAGTAVLKWDNTYSRVQSKLLSFRAESVPHSTAKAAVLAAEEQDAREKQRR